MLPLALFLLSACQHDALSDARSVVSAELDAEQTDAVDAYAEGKAHLKNRRYGLALSAFGRDVQQNGASVHVLNALAATYSALGRDDLALRYFTEAEKLDPTSSLTAHNLAHFRKLQNAAVEPETEEPVKPADLEVAKASSGGTVYVQLAAFRAQPNAAALAAKLADLGAHVTPGTHRGRTVHRVRIGPLPGADAATVLKQARDFGIRDGFILSAL
jgi:cell division septation protein DedD